MPVKNTANISPVQTEARRLLMRLKHAETRRKLAAHDELVAALRACEDAMTREDFGTITLLPKVRAALAKVES